MEMYYSFDISCYYLLDNYDVIIGAIISGNGFILFCTECSKILFIYFLWQLLQAIQINFVVTLIAKRTRFVGQPVYTRNTND